MGKMKDLYMEIIENDYVNPFELKVGKYITHEDISKDISLEIIDRVDNDKEYSKNYSLSSIVVKNIITGKIQSIEFDNAELRLRGEIGQELAKIKIVG